ncbi:MAG: hypothetical protein ACI3Y5_01980 [Prevotella sp.]
MISLVIYLMYLALAASIGVTAWSVVRRMRMLGHTSGRVHGIPVRKINILIVLSVILLMLLSFLFASVSPVRIGTKDFTDVLWIRVAGMFVLTGVIVLLAGVVSIIYSFVKNGGIKVTLRAMVRPHYRHKQKGNISPMSPKATRKRLDNSSRDVRRQESEGGGAAE